MRTKQALIVLLSVTVVLLAGCGGAGTAGTAEATEIPVVTQAEGKVVAEAVIEPARSNELRFEASGEVVEVLVQEGDVVNAGDPLARLETTDLERAIARAELDLEQAKLRLAKLQEPPDEEDIRQAEHAVSQAAAAIKVAQMDVDTIQNSVILNETLEDAQEVYEEMKHRYETRQAQYAKGEVTYFYVDQAQERYDDAKLNLERIQQQGGGQLQDARNELTRASQSYQEAQDRLAVLQKGADEHDIEAAELEIKSAELALEEARAALEDTTLTAPVAGVVTQVAVDEGEMASPGETVLTLATLERLEAHTKDLTELDVARVKVGQAVVVTVDALPGQEFAGVVQEIALQPGDYRGDVVYTVVVELKDVANTPLRWGMTAMVEITVQ